jgi:hypothetical protein
MGWHARTSRRRGPHYGGKVTKRRGVTKTPATATPTGTGGSASSRLRRVLLGLGLVLLAVNLRPVRAPDPTAARNGKVDAQLYTSAIGFFHNNRKAAAFHQPGL